MTQISVEWLRAHGVQGPDEDVLALAQRCEEVLEWRVGVSLAEMLTDAEIEEFEQFMEAAGPEGTDASDDDPALDWLKAHYPQYPATVEREVDLLKHNIAQSADPAAYILGLAIGTVE